MVTAAAIASLPVLAAHTALELYCRIKGLAQEKHARNYQELGPLYFKRAYQMIFFQFKELVSMLTYLEEKKANSKERAQMATF